MSAVETSQITIYPIKSTAGIDLGRSWVEEKGLSFDRRFVLSDLSGQFITARTEPKLCLIKAAITPSGFKLSAPQMPTLSLDYHTLSNSYVPVTVWKDLIQGQQANDQINQWFNAYLGKPCQLLFFGEESQRKVKNRTSQVGFADGYPLLLISEASLNALNERTREPVSMAQFRPNIVVKGCDAFEEDTWKRIRIGDVEFEVTKPCSRCIFTTVDPTTGQKSRDLEPLKSLKEFRKGESGEVYFGQNLVALNEGQINISDRVEVLAYQTPEVYPDTQSKYPQKPVSYEKSNWPSSRQITLQCTDIIDETHDVKTFVFASDEVQRFEYIAGQHLPITFHIAGQKVKRPYTLSSTPSRPNSVSITVKRVEGGQVSNFIHDHFNIGDSIDALPPSGEFNLEKATQNKLLFLTAGSGITPALSMLRTLVAHQDTRDVVFFHSAKMARDLIADEEIQSLARAHGNCQVTYTLTQGMTPTWEQHQGRLTEDMLKSIPSLCERSVFVCGPHEFMVSAKEMLLNLGLPKDQYFEESFGDRKLVQETKAVNKKVNILFDSWDTNHQGNNQQTLLEQAEDAGLILPYSCRAGMCGSCRVKLESGEVESLADDGLMPKEKEQGYVLACSCIPMTDVVVSRG